MVSALVLGSGRAIPITKMYKQLDNEQNTVGKQCSLRENIFFLYPIQWYLPIFLCAIHFPDIKFYQHSEKIRRKKKSKWFSEPKKLKNNIGSKCNN